MTTGEKLALLRKKKGKTQEELAEALHSGLQIKEIRRKRKWKN